MIEKLSANPLFAGISKGELSHLINQVTVQKRTFEKKQLIAQSDEACDHLLMILKGSVRGDMIDFSGKTIKIEDIEAPSPVGSAFLFGEKRAFPVNIVANENVEILMIPRYSVVKMFQLNQKFLENFLNMISTRAQFLSMKIRFLSFKTIKGKIAQYLLGQAGPFQKTITLTRSQQSLADLFGVTRPSLARAMGALHKEGVIHLNRKEITLLQRDKLNQLLNEHTSKT